MMTDATMRDFALVKTEALLADVVHAIGSAAETPEAEPVHKMRVAIRRLQQAIRLFRQYVSPDGSEKVRAQLRAIMQIAGELRNRDIAIPLITDAGGNAAQLQEQRTDLQRQLTDLLRSYREQDLLEAWRVELALGTA